MKSAGMMTDSELVRRCIDKDQDAWSVLVSRYSRLVEIAAFRRLKKYGFHLPKDRIDDIRQDVFTAIWSKEKLKGVKGTNKISHWLAVVSGNMAIDHIRAGKNLEFMDTASIEEKFQENLAAELLAPGSDPESGESHGGPSAGKINEAIKGLGRLEKLIIKLHLIHGKKHNEIVEMLNLPKGTVCSCIKRAKDKLRIRLKDFLIIFAIFSAFITSIYMEGKIP
jgi:RNA polymerase sigma-70 factor (ECF subfamily)